VPAFEDSGTGSSPCSGKAFGTGSPRCHEDVTGSTSTVLPALIPSPLALSFRQCIFGLDHQVSLQDLISEHL